ncbi:peptidase C14 [Microbacterium capsulatum]|uniref:Peptidase C14 n=1 Tax=Microbacterium capsulatum TaxID=3041921 RepID=A0ABU0XIZ8_9MICO|nr:peptidase C14 [Microbacterium sp. ASV81]MDQ4215110.1 peptidase C14 [Microbacterium sp. ASV81]
MTDTIPQDTVHRAERRSRRLVLAGFGAAAVGGLAAAVATAAPANAATGSDARNAASVATVSALASLTAKADDMVAVSGYAHPGDGGGGLFRCITADQPAVNGGTVVPGRSGAVWARVHSGTIDFRAFGIFGPETPADEALDALVADQAVVRIEAHTDLNFVRRHKFSRSGIAFDFGGRLMTTEGIEKAGKDDPFAAVMYFCGEVTAEEHTAALGEGVPDLADVLPVGDSSFFAVGEWYAAEVNALSGRWERELQKLVQVTQIVDGSHVRINYQIGWPLGADRSITWRHVKPVQNVVVSNLRFQGKGTDEYTGSHPLAFEYAVRCDVDHIDGTATFWPLIMRRWNTSYTTESCSLKNPTSVTWGGAGYMTQQIYCLYGYVANSRTSNARHLNDFTASAYCLVENCHGDGDDQGPFVTHGQYEHDLTYVGNSGLMTFANSGAPWGSAAKRITVRKHVCSWFVARVKVTDLTLEDVRVIGKKGLNGSGMLWINADGAQLRGCSATDTLIITQSSSASKRPTVIEASDFAFAAAGDLTNASVSAPVTFVDTVLSGVNGVRIGGAGPVTFRGGRLSGGDRDAAFGTLSARLRLDGVDLDGVRIDAAGKDAQAVEILGGSALATTKGTGLSRSGAGDLTVVLGDSTFTGGGTYVSIGAGVNHYRATGCRFDGGALELPAQGFGAKSTLLHSGNVETGLKRTVPAEAANVVLSGNVVV